MPRTPRERPVFDEEPGTWSGLAGGQVVGAVAGEPTPAQVEDGSARSSGVWLKGPCVMLVRIEHAAELPELDEEGRRLRVVRVRHPVPACQRMAVLQPRVVIVGESVREWDFALLQAQARKIGAAILRLGPLVSREAIPGWLRQVLESDMKTRTQPAGG
jgi:hypothetical protein